MGWAFSIYKVHDGQLQKQFDMCDAMLGTLGDSFVAESMAQLKAWETMNSTAEEWGIDENTMTTLITDSQRIAEHNESQLRDHCKPAMGAWQNVCMGKVKCRWIPAHCGREKQDEVDERA